MAAPVTSSDDLIAMAQRVSDCENGGSWVPLGPAYPDGVGLTAANWAQFGGTSDTSPAATAQVLAAFLAYYGMSWPDQHGCTGSY